MPYIKYMGDKQSPPPVNTMNTFPFSTPHQLIVDMANSARHTLELIESNTRTGDLRACHATRIHELMNFRPHTVDTDGF